MTRKELIEFYYSLEETHAERKRLGEFDANSKHMMVLLEGMLLLTKNAIEQAKDDGKRR